MSQGKFVQEKTTDYYFYSIDYFGIMVDFGLVLLVILLLIILKRNKK